MKSKLGPYIADGWDLTVRSTPEKTFEATLTNEDENHIDGFSYTGASPEQVLAAINKDLPPYVELQMFFLEMVITPEDTFEVRQKEDGMFEVFAKVQFASKSGLGMRVEGLIFRGKSLYEAFNKLIRYRMFGK